MGRRRKEEDQWMPPRVYRGRSAFELKPVSGGTINLCPLGASKSRVWERYQQEKAKLECRVGSFADLVAKYFDSEKYASLSERTRDDYQKYSIRVLKVYGRTHVDRITPPEITKYVDKRSQKAPTQANREQTFISAVYTWGIARGYAKANPCVKGQKNSEKPRDVYIEDEAYYAVLEFSRPLLFAAMEISYSCAARQGDVLQLTPEQLQDQGIYIKQGKTGKAQIKAWSERLRHAVKVARSQTKVPSIRWVLADKNGQRISANRLRHWFRQAKEQAAKKYPQLDFNFTFHDIKAKSISDVEGTRADKQKFSGHKTQSQVAVYDRKTEIVDTH